MYEFRANWTGGRIGQGVTVFHFEEGNDLFDANDVATAFRSWFNGMKTFIPDDVTITFPTELKKINPVTGDATEVRTVTPQAPVVGTDSIVFAAPAGRIVKWQTNAFNAGRRLVGRTFLVPSSGCFTTSGSVSSSAITQDATHHSDLINDLAAADALLVIWSRKNGTTGVVASGATQERPTTLRSRND